MVYVGPKAKRYSVHEALLSRYEWFRKQILDASNVASPGSITLRAEDPKVFELLISWLYGRKLKNISNTGGVLAEEEATLYITAYLRACEWAIYDLQNALMDRLRVRQICEYGDFPPNVIQYIYANTGSDSPLRLYAVDSYIYRGIKWNEYFVDQKLALTRTRAFQNQLDAGNQAFALDCYEALFELCAKSKTRNPDKKTGCNYHKHMDGERCGL